MKILQTHLQNVVKLFAQVLQIIIKLHSYDTPDIDTTKQPYRAYVLSFHPSVYTMYMYVVFCESFGLVL